MTHFAKFRKAAALTALIAATTVSTASADPMNPFEALFGPLRPPVSAPAFANPGYGNPYANQGYADPGYANPHETYAAPDESTGGVRADLRRQVVNYPTREAPGTIIVDTPNTFLYYVLGNGKAIRYGIGVGREGFTWSGTKTIERKAEWPDWTPPPEMISRQPYLPRFVAGGPSNPLGARALYLSGSVYRIHGTNDPSTIGGHVSSGCIRMVNEDVIDLYNRAHVGTKVVVLPAAQHRASRSVDGIY